MAHHSSPGNSSSANSTSQSMNFPDWLAALLGTIAVGNPIVGMLTKYGIQSSQPDSSTGKTGWDKIGDLITGQAQTTAQAEAQSALNAEQNAFNSAEAEKNREWEEHMRDTSITSAFNQYQSLGVNPMLAINGGQGVTSAASSSASGSSGNAVAGQNIGGSLAMASAVGISAILTAVAKLISKK